MIAETRAKPPVAAARTGSTASGLCRGLDGRFHRHGGPDARRALPSLRRQEGLLEAVIAQIDAEMNERICAISIKGMADRWHAFVDEIRELH